jgi:cation diffusion facilitator CzcD-associated flavoprotein CzcO
MSKKSSGRADVVVIGAGFAGLYALYRFRDVLGLDVRVFETGDGVGGTWYWNRYPGARCDSESFYYSYSFSEELDQEWTWSSKYPEQPEILQYLEHVADRFDLAKDIQFATKVVSAIYDEPSATWTVRTDQGDTVRASFVVTAVGCLSAANMPDIPGIEGFGGDSYHTGAWPKDGVDFSNRRVALIGTGSSGIQSTPVIAAEADHLTVFQRTANYTVPTRNTALTPEATAWVKTNYPEIRQKTRDTGAGFPYDPIARSAFEVTDEEREEIFESLWQEGGFKFMWGSFNDLMQNKAANTLAADFIRKKIREMVNDPETAEKLCPNDHPWGSKRPPIDTDYFTTYNRDNVDLVDLKAEPIEAITEKGVRTAAGEYPVDTIVYATGFDAMTGSLLKIDIQGKDGVTLGEKWSAGPRTYLGLQVAGFPNLFTITGPGSPSVLMNMPVAIEQHVNWISDCIVHMRETGAKKIEADLDAENLWVEHVNDAAQATLFYEARSWYLGVNIPGKPRVFMPYVGGGKVYSQICDQVVQDGYEGFALDGPSAKSSPALEGPERFSGLRNKIVQIVEAGMSTK